MQLWYRWLTPASILFQATNSKPIPPATGVTATTVIGEHNTRKTPKKWWKREKKCSKSIHKNGTCYNQVGTNQNAISVAFITQLARSTRGTGPCLSTWGTNRADGKQHGIIVRGLFQHKRVHPIICTIAQGPQVWEQSFSFYFLKPFPPWLPWLLKATHFEFNLVETSCPPPSSSLKATSGESSVSSEMAPNCPTADHHHRSRQQTWI